MGWSQDYSKCVCQPLPPIDPPPTGGGNANATSVLAACLFLPPGTTGPTGDTGPTGPTGGTGNTGTTGLTSKPPDGEWEPWEPGEPGGGPNPGPGIPNPWPPANPGPNPGGTGPTTPGGGPTTPGGGPTTPGGGPTTPGGGPTTPGGGPTTPGGGPTTPGGSVIQNNNIPGQVIFTNPFSDLADNVDIPVPSRNSTIPPTLFEELSSEKLFRVPESNLDYFTTDFNHNIDVDTNAERLKFASNKGRSGADHNNIFSDSYNLTLADLLDGKGGAFNAPYNGVTIGALLQGDSLIKNSLSEETKEALDYLSQYNINSVELKNFYIKALKSAVIDGSISEYSPSFFRNIGEQARIAWPLGVPHTGGSQAANLIAAYAVAEDRKESLFAGGYLNGDTQRMIQKYRLLPTDIDLCIPIRVRDGRMTGIRFSNDDTIPVVTRVGVEKVVQKNEYLPLVTNSPSTGQVELASKRSVAYKLSDTSESLIQSLVGNRLYSIDLQVSSTTAGGSVSSVEVSAVPTELPSLLLYSSKRETIKETPSPSPYLTQTNVEYEQVWTSNEESLDTFNSTTSSYSGPRSSFVIPADDPIWSYLLENNNVTVTYRDFTVPIEGEVFARKILTDFCIFPTNKVQHSSLKGKSKLTSFVEGSPTTRQISFALSPPLENQQMGYVAPTLDPELKNPGGEDDIFALQFTKSITTGQVTSRFSKNNTFLQSSKSMLAVFLDQIATINDNYNLENGAKGYSLPMGDLTSFVNANTYLKFLTHVPSSVQYNLFQGVYNNIKVFAVNFADSEKTFITNSRLKDAGTDLTSSQTQTSVPSAERYFDSIYNRILFRR